MEKNNKRKNKVWTEKEECIILDMWKEFLPSLRKAKRNKHVYIEMAKQIFEVYSINISPEEIQRKLSNMSQKYRSEKCLKGVSGGSPSLWKHYNAVHDIIGNFASNDTSKMHESKTFNFVPEQLDITDESIASSAPATFPEDAYGRVTSESTSSSAARVELWLDPLAGGSTSTPVSKNRKRKSTSDRIAEQIEETNKLLKEDIKGLQEYLKESNSMQREFVDCFKALTAAILNKKD